MEWKKFKQAITNPPAERIARIEYQSHLLQGLGILFVCIMLIYKGFWWIIFALVFGLGVSYSQGITAYRKYKAIVFYVGEENPKEYTKDISPSRRRSKIIKYALGNSVPYVVATFSTVAAFLIINPTLSRWKLILLYPSVIMLLYIFFYFYFSYWVAYPIYKAQMKGGSKNGQTKKTKR